MFDGMLFLENVIMMKKNWKLKSEEDVTFSIFTIILFLQLKYVN